MLLLFQICVILLSVTIKIRYLLYILKYLLFKKNKTINPKKNSQKYFFKSVLLGWIHPGQSSVQVDSHHYARWYFRPLTIYSGMVKCAVFSCRSGYVQLAVSATHETTVAALN